MKLDVGLGETINLDGQVVEVDALRIVEEIKKYDPNLDVLCLDPNMAPDIHEAPFILVETCEDGVQRRVFEFWELDQRILDRIKGADKNRGFDALKFIETTNAVLLDKERRRYREEMDELQDLTAAIVKGSHKKSSFTYKDETTGDMVTIYEDRPSTRGLANGRHHYSG